MKIDMGYTIKNLDGKDIKEIIVAEDKNGKPKRDKDGIPLLTHGDSITLRKVCEESLVNPRPVTDPTTKRTKEIPADKQIDAWNFAQRIHASDGLMELTIGEIEELIKVIDKKYASGPDSIAIVAQSHVVLDPTGVVKKKTESTAKNKEDN